jgi:pimeloyl-ACP methyl ester carboxylesterase
MRIVRSNDGTTIAYERNGDGPPIILVDGAMVYREFGPAKPMSALLAPHFSVIAYDRRGRGESGDAYPYAVEREIEDIEALIREAGGEAFVYGVSTGGVLALEAAACGLPITRLAVYEPPFLIDDSRPPLPDDYLEEFKRLLSAGRRGDMLAHFMTKGVGQPAEEVEAMRNAPFWPRLESVAHTLIYDTTIMGDFKLPPERTRKWASIQAPTLVMGGEESPASLQNAVRAVAAAVPGAALRMLEGQTHDAAPEVIARQLLPFFQEGFFQ